MISFTIPNLTLISSPSFFTGFYVLSAIFLVKTIYGLYKNISIAKQSGIPYVIVPTFAYNRFWLVTQDFIIPLLNCLPNFLKEPWIHMIHVDWTWHSRYYAFERLKTDSFLQVSPFGLVLFTADPIVISQIISRRQDFPKFLQLYGIMNIYGRNVLTTEDAEWRRHRRVIGPAFNERNLQRLWEETIVQTNLLLDGWLGQPRQNRYIQHNVSHDTMRLSLHVIIRAGFGLHCLWPGVNDNNEKLLAQGYQSSSHIPTGHKMSCLESMSTVLDHIILITVCPRFILKYFFPTVNTAYHEWGQHIQDRYTSKLIEYRTNDTRDRTKFDLMDAMISSLQDENKDAARLTWQELIGNSFMFLISGHETTADTIQMALIYLATHPWMITKVHHVLDTLFGDTPCQQWDYEQTMPRLMKSYLGAVVKETLRLAPPVMSILKRTDHRPQPIHMNGRDVVIPPQTCITISAVATHRNPKYWPCHPTIPRYPWEKVQFPVSNLDNDIEEFRPERWFTKQSSDHDPNLDMSTDTHDDVDLFEPRRFSYIPFSEGQRACIGKRFALVEIITFLAVFFKQYTVRLSYTIPVSSASHTERIRFQRAAWIAARNNAMSKIRYNMSTVITLKMRHGSIPLEIVRRHTQAYKTDHHDFNFDPHFV